MSTVTTRAAQVVLAFILCGCVQGPPIEERASAAMPANSLQTFEWRRLHGSGQYITGETLARERLTPLSTLLRTHLVGFQMPASALAIGPVTRATCTTQVYVDGLWAPGALEEGVHTEDVAGVEYYSAATTPIQFRRANNVCPTLLLWLRH